MNHISYAWHYVYLTLRYVWRTLTLPESKRPEHSPCEECAVCYNDGGIQHNL